ncbi:MAG TPA: hypothetical protein ENH55_13140 [Aurantimonas coralicida]|uniref:Chromosomal replication initiator DnaA C-terminal domain-containing protein n=2 Tax=root TaxID=1 RepID=A0A9C9NEB3_9HYPH|nr:hypothetical protein [Aurantimonas coralicida]HET99622.1 hypothetical protein [Aurantimonas coralicida]
MNGPTIRCIQRETAIAFDVPLDAMTERGATRDLTRARHAAMYLARCLTNKSFPVVARCFGRDHATIMYGVDRVRHFHQRDPDFKRRINAAAEAVAKTVK